MAIGVAISTWFILCTFTLTLFLAAAKRRGELEQLREDAARHRPALAAYEVPFLDQVIGVLASATIVCYALYATGIGDGGLSASRWMHWTIPFVLYGVLRYLHLVQRRRWRGGSDGPAVERPAPAGHPSPVGGTQPGAAVHGGAGPAGRLRAPLTAGPGLVRMRQPPRKGRPPARSESRLVRTPASGAPP